METAARWLPPLWALVLTLLVLGPLLAPGYVLTYDMVWVPDLALRPDFAGLGSGLPRAVPSDAVVAVLDEVVPGMVLQKATLFGTFLVAGLGAMHLAPPGSLAGRLVAVSVYVWNPFVAERLQLGHWPVLLGYAVLPWAIVVARRARAGRVAWTLGPLLVVGSLSASAGLVTAAVALTFALRRGARRTNVVVAALVVGANAPWVVSGLLHADTAVTDAAGAKLFALNDAGLLPGPVAALGLGGTWNTEVLLPSRQGVLAVVALTLLVGLAAFGARSFWEAHSTRDSWAFLGCWATGWLAAVATFATPDLVGRLAETLPGAGLLRDGSRLLALCAPMVAALAAHGAHRLVSLGPVPVARTALAASFILAPVAVMPDAVWGLSGRLRPVEYPTAYVDARDRVERLYAAGLQGDTLVLPLTSYRAPGWNDGRKVLDPLGRYLPGDYVASDELVVSGRRVEGEDPRVAEAACALEQRSPLARAERLGQLGIRFVVHDVAAGEAPLVSGTAAGGPASLRVVALSTVRPREASAAWAAAMSVAWLLFALAGVAPVLGTRLRRLPKRPDLDLS